MLGKAAELNAQQSFSDDRRVSICDETEIRVDIDFGSEEEETGQSKVLYVL
jgi:hypothetical protein